jgi:hypothetical protein
MASSITARLARLEAALGIRGGSSTEPASTEPEETRLDALEKKVKAQHGIIVAVQTELKGKGK